MKNQERISYTGENDITPINVTNVRQFPYNKETLKNTNIISNIESEYNLEREETAMDENKILEKYLDKVDQDRRDQEQRLSNNMQSMENRLFEDRKLMEQRITEERRLSEDRMEKKFNEAMEALKSTNAKIDNLDIKLDTETQKTIDKIDSTNKWIIGTCIASVLAVAGIAASAIWGALWSTVFSK